jgi:hypothetical protein
MADPSRQIPEGATDEARSTRPFRFSPQTRLQSTDLFGSGSSGPGSGVATIGSVGGEAPSMAPGPAGLGEPKKSAAPLTSGPLHSRVREYEASGLTAAEFARHRGFHQTTLSKYVGCISRSAAEEQSDFDHLRDES